MSHEKMKEEQKSPDSTVRTVIGWREWVAFPEIGIPGIKAKIDTGARSSALHTHDYEIFEGADGQRVRFNLHPLRGKETMLSCEAPLLEFREVKDSGGHGERRPFIRARARIGDIEWEIDLSLTNREGMKFRMLLGRSALAGLFTIDPSANYLYGKNLSHEYRK